jgi:hypothetical protein
MFCRIEERRAKLVGVANQSAYSDALCRIYIEGAVTQLKGQFMHAVTHLSLRDSELRNRMERAFFLPVKISDAAFPSGH